MNRLPALLSAMFLTSALATPALARTQSTDGPSCGGDKKDESSKKGSSFVPSCGDDKKDKKDTKS